MSEILEEASKSVEGSLSECRVLDVDMAGFVLTPPWT
jgi:hypothetical protein